MNDLEITPLDSTSAISLEDACARLIDFALQRVQEELRRLLPGEFSASLTVAELARVREELVAELSGRPDHLSA